MKEYNNKIKELIEYHKKELSEKNKTVIKFKIISKASRTEFTGVMDDNTIKLSVNKVAERGKANAEICAFLSKEFDADKKDVKIISGQSSRLKLISIKKED